MHDPLVVAHKIPSPIPHRKPWKDRDRQARRWGFARSRRTNTENLGQPVYRWWRPKGWTLYLGGRAYGLGTLATIWHVEPDGRDSGEVCKHWADGKPKSAWKWHVHHWSIQIPALQEWRSRLFDRCAECGRKGRPNISHQWDGPGVGWRKWRSRPGLYHRECSALVSLRRERAVDVAVIQMLAAELRLLTDETEPQLIERLHRRAVPGENFTDSFRRAYRVEKVLGYELRDSGHGALPEFVKATGR